MRDAEFPRRGVVDVGAREVDDGHLEHLEPKRKIRPVSIHEGHRRGDVGPGRGAHDPDALRVDAEFGRLLEQPDEHRVPLLDRNRIAIFGSQRIVHRDDRHLGVDGAAPEGGIRRRIVDPADAERAAEEGQHGGHGRIADHVGVVDAHARTTGQPENFDVMLHRPDLGSRRSDVAPLAAVPREGIAAIRGPGASARAECRSGVGLRRACGRRGRRRQGGRVPEPAERRHSRTHRADRLVDQVLAVHAQALVEERIQWHPKPPCVGSRRV